MNSGRVKVDAGGLKVSDCLDVEAKKEDGLRLWHGTDLCHLLAYL